MKYLWKETDFKWEALGLAVVATISYTFAFYMNRKYGL